MELLRILKERRKLERLCHGLTKEGAPTGLPSNIMVENIGRQLAPGKKGTASAQNREINAVGCLQRHPEAIQGNMGGSCPTTVIHIKEKVSKLILLSFVIVIVLTCHMDFIHV